MTLYKIMQHQQKGFNLRNVIAVYNCTCVLAAGYVVVGLVQEKIIDRGTFACNDGIKPVAACYRVSHLLWAFYIQKFWEFMDTWFFILRKSFRQVSFLHLFHHSSITVVVGMILPHDFCGDMYLPVFLNSFVHVLMYAHYLVTALGIRSWWREYLTSLQLIQFVLISTQSLYALYRGPDCGVPDWAKFLLIAYMCSMLLLFGNFFVRRYLIKSPGPVPDMCAGVIKENENGEETKVFDGSVVLGKDGKAKVDLGNYFAFVLTTVQQSQITLIYQLTPVGASMPELHVGTEAQGKGSTATFEIAGGKPGKKVSWSIVMKLTTLNKDKSE